MRVSSDEYCVVCEQVIFERLAGGILDGRPPAFLPTPDEEWTHVVAVPESPALPNASDLVAYNSKTGHLAVYDTIDFFSATPSAVARVRTLAGAGFLSMTTFAAGLDQFIYLDNFFTDRRMMLKIGRATIGGSSNVIQIFSHFANVPPGCRRFLQQCAASRTSCRCNFPVLHPCCTTTARPARSSSSSSTRSQERRRRPPRPRQTR